jgi:hypothetical protein
VVRYIELVVGDVSVAKPWSDRAEEPGDAPSVAGDL